MRIAPIASASNVHRGATECDAGVLGARLAALQLIREEAALPAAAERLVHPRAEYIAKAERDVRPN